MSTDVYVETVQACALSYADAPSIENLYKLKRSIANLQDPSSRGTGPSALSLARQVVRDCKDSKGQFYEAGLVDALSDAYCKLYRAQGRLPLFRDVVTGEVHE